MVTELTPRFVAGGRPVRNLSVWEAAGYELLFEVRWLTIGNQWLALCSIVECWMIAEDWLQVIDNALDRLQLRAVCDH